MCVLQGRYEVRACKLGQLFNGFFFITALTVIPRTDEYSVAFMLFDINKLTVG